MVEKRHEVTVLTGLPNYPEGSVSKEYKWFRKRKEKINGVNVLRCFEIGRRCGSFFLALNFISFMISSSIKAIFLKGDYDIVFCYQLSPISMTLPAIIYKKRKKKKLCLYCLDIWPESLKSILKHEDNIIFHVVKRFSNYIYRYCDEICVTSEPFIKYLNTVHKVDESKLFYLPQHADDKYLSLDLESVIYEHINLLFTGNIGIAQDLDCLIDAVSCIEEKKQIRIHIVGDGSYLQQCINRVHEKELENYFVFYGRRPASEMVDFYRTADACLLMLKDDNYTGQTLPGKLQEYMAVGKPIVGAIDGAAQKIIKEAECGICVNASDYMALAEAIKDFADNPEKYSKCGRNGRAYFKQYFTKEIYMTKLENALSGLIGNGQNSLN